MAPRKLKEALKLAEEASSSSRSSSKLRKVCEEQCSVLRTASLHVAHFLKEMQPIIKDGPALEEVMLVTQRALQLIRACEQDDWIISALFREEGRQDFQDVHSDLCNSIDLLGSVFPSSTVDTGASSEQLEAAASKDRRQLITIALEEEQKLKRKLRKAGQEPPLQILSSTLVQMLLQEDLPQIERSQLKLNKLLGGGNYGSVYEVNWLGYTFAAKVFNRGDTSFPRELFALSSHRHPNILPVVGQSFDPNEQQHCLLMEKMEMDLEHLLTKRSSKKHQVQLESGLPLPLLASLSIMVQIAKAMAYLHSRMVIHRDLKPKNVLCNCIGSGSYQVKIADFGLARSNFFTSQVTYATPKAGTKIFTAPEVWNADPDKPRYSKRSDVYSYAMLCYQLLTGKKPFSGLDTVSRDFMLRVGGGLRPEFPSGFPVELAQLLKTCWSGEPDNRLQFSEVLGRLKSIKASMIAEGVLSSV